MQTHAEDASDRLLHLIRSEFTEMPGLRLTEAQAARLWNVDIGTAQMALALLVERGVLVRTGDGRHIRASH